MASGGKNPRTFLLALALLLLAGVPARACPDLSTCKADEQMSIERDAQGCNVVTCLKAEANQVDDYYQDIPQVPKMQTVENSATVAPVTTIEPITGPKPEVKEPESPKRNVAEETAQQAEIAAPQMAAEPESQKQPVVGEIAPLNESVVTKTPETSLEPQPVAPEKAPRADAPAASTNKASPPSAI